MKSPAKSPCGSCPYRQDVPSGVWAESEYERLPEYDRPTHEQPVAVFGCHQNDGRLCAGWVGCHDMDQNLGLRIAAATRRMSAEDVDATLAYVSPVPLFGSGAEAAKHGIRDIDTPGDRAKRTVARLAKKLEKTDD